MSKDVFPLPTSHRKAIDNLNGEGIEEVKIGRLIPDGQLIFELLRARLFHLVSTASF